MTDELAFTNALEAATFAKSLADGIAEAAPRDPAPGG